MVQQQWQQHSLRFTPPRPPPPPTPLTDTRRYRLGNAFHELKLDFHAAACYRRCLALNRNDVRYWNDLGSAYTAPSIVPAIWY